MKKNITNIDISNKKVIIRCDFNVPMKDGIIQDDTRIRASLETINYCLDKGCSLILLSHLGKVKNDEDKDKNSLFPVSVRLGELLDREVLFSYDTRSDKLTSMCNNLKSREILLIENTRFEDLDGNKESGCDLDLAKYWASLGDVFINDAYGTCHRSHASNVGISKYLESGLGFLVMKEISKLDGIINDNSHPYVVIMGGAKVADKIKMIENLITKCDKLLIGGGMAYTFLKALGYNVGNSLIDNDSIDFCNNMLNNYKNKIVLPIDSIVSESLDSDKCELCDIDKFDDNDCGYDIGPKTIELFKNNLKDSKRVIMNGPMGVFENKLYENGTREILEFLVRNNIKTLIGGGDSASSVNKFNLGDKFYHVSTGGGATLEYLEGKVLPGIGAISDEK